MEGTLGAEFIRGGGMLLGFKPATGGGTMGLEGGGCGVAALGGGGGVAAAGFVSFYTKSVSERRVLFGIDMQLTSLLTHRFSFSS